MAFVTLRGDVEPTAYLERLRDQVNRLFEGGPSGSADERRWLPPANVEESPEEIRVRFPLPGIDPEALSVAVENGVLRIEGERLPPRSDGQVVRVERLSGRFRRDVEVPVPVDSARVDASYRHGILTVTLPKAAEAKPRRIQVRAES